MTNIQPGRPQVLAARSIGSALPRIDAQCTASDLLSWMGAGDDCTTQSSAVHFPTRRLRAGATLVHEGAAFESLYFVGVGTIKCFQTDEEGYEQALGFAMRGDVVGFDAVCQSHHPTAALALEDSIVAVVPFRDLIRIGHSLPALERVWHEATSRELLRHNGTMHVMAAVGAEVRLARFLLQLADRHVAIGMSSRRMLLRMGRRDIASHLGVAHETVSRSFTALADWGYIKVMHREIEIVDRDGLKAFQRNTRGVVDPVVGRAHANGAAARASAVNGNGNGNGSAAFRAAARRAAQVETSTLAAAAAY